MTNNKRSREGTSSAVPEPTTFSFNLLPRDVKLMISTALSSEYFEPGLASCDVDYTRATTNTLRDVVALTMTNKAVYNFKEEWYHHSWLQDLVPFAQSDGLLHTSCVIEYNVQNCTLSKQMDLKSIKPLQNVGISLELFLRDINNTHEIVKRSSYRDWKTGHFPPLPTQHFSCIDKVVIDKVVNLSFSLVDTLPSVRLLKVIGIDLLLPSGKRSKQCQLDLIKRFPNLTTLSLQIHREPMTLNCFESLTNLQSLLVDGYTWGAYRTSNTTMQLPTSMARMRELDLRDVIVHDLDNVVANMANLEKLFLCQVVQRVNRYKNRIEEWWSSSSCTLTREQYEKNLTLLNMDKFIIRPLKSHLPLNLARMLDNKPNLTSIVLDTVEVINIAFVEEMVRVNNRLQVCTAFMVVDKQFDRIDNCRIVSKRYM